MVCTNPHTKLVHVTPSQKGDQTSEWYRARNVNRQNRLYSTRDTPRTCTHIHCPKLKKKKKNTSNLEAHLKPNRHEANASKSPKLTEQPRGVSHTGHSLLSAATEDNFVCRFVFYSCCLQRPETDPLGLLLWESSVGVPITRSSLPIPTPQVTTFHSCCSGEPQS